MEKDFYTYYSEIEDKHWWFVGRREIFLRLLDRYLAPPEPGREREVLDVGCGTGTMLQHLRKYGRPVGVESEIEAVKLCRDRGVTAVELGHPPPLPFSSGRFELVTALDVLEHVDDDAALLDEIARVLRPGGQALVAVPAYKCLWGLQDEVSHHKRRYVARELKSKVVASGLLVQRLSYFNTLLFPPIGVVRLARRVFKHRRPNVGSDFELNKPGRLNVALARIFASERAIIERADLPFGVSILALAKKSGT